MQARAYWVTGDQRGEIRDQEVAAPGPGEALLTTLRSGISRGTESLIHSGRVPARVGDLMRAPWQSGDFPWPVKYGYLNVAEVTAGPPGLVGRRVFCLYPHQTRYVVPAEALTLIPDGVPTDRAVLAGTCETAVNVVWDAGPRFHDLVAVVGMGMVGASIAVLLSRFPLARLQVVDVDPDRAELAKRLGVEWVSPHEALGDCDIVVHCSGTEEGLEAALALAGTDGEVIEASWFGDRVPAVPLGGDFHARRLQLRASQVGAIALARRHRRTHKDRLAAALDALHDDRFDALLGPGCDFDDLPRFLPELSSGRSNLPGLCHVVRYPVLEPVPSDQKC